MARVTKKLQKEEIKKIKDMVKALEVVGEFDPNWEDFDKAVIILRAIQLQAGFVAELMEASKAQREWEEYNNYIEEKYPIPTIEEYFKIEK